MFTSAIVYRSMVADAQAQALVRSRNARALLTEPVKPMSPQELQAHLQGTSFLPGETLSALLKSVDLHQRTLEKLKLRNQLRDYDQLYWFQKPFCAVPGVENAKVKTIPFEMLERRFSHKAEQAQLFCAVCELHDLGLITLQAEPPFALGVTPKGARTLEALKEEEGPPSYASLRLTDDVVTLTQPATD